MTKKNICRVASILVVLAIIAMGVLTILTYIYPDAMPEAERDLARGVLMVGMGALAFVGLYTARVGWGLFKKDR